MAKYDKMRIRLFDDKSDYIMWHICIIVAISAKVLRMLFDLKKKTKEVSSSTTIDTGLEQLLNSVNAGTILLSPN